MGKTKPQGASQSEPQHFCMLRFQGLQPWLVAATVQCQPAREMQDLSSTMGRTAPLSRRDSRAEGGCSQYGSAQYLYHINVNTSNFTRGTGCQ